MLASSNDHSFLDADCMDIRYDLYCRNLKDTGKYRVFPEQKPALMLDFSTNDYLGLSRHPALMKAANNAGTQYGVGATGSRLLSGNNDLFVGFEAQIARDKGTECALIFSSGFQANLSVLASLLDARVLGAQALVFFDRLNHASLYQAVFLSGALLIRYRHADANHLADLLDKHQGDSRPKFIVTETVFGMDGDVAPLQDIADLARAANALLYLDEAHATGVQGPYGLSGTLDLREIVCVIMGTFSKALGCSGAYIASNRAVCDYIINRAHGFVYSTALSPMVVGAAAHAWEMVRHMDVERARLIALADSLRTHLASRSIDTGNSSTHIVPIILGREAYVISAKEVLGKAGIRVSAVRQPTVPPGTARLRIAVCVGHTQDDIARLATELKRV